MTKLVMDLEMDENSANSLGCKKDLAAYSDTEENGSITDDEVKQVEKKGFLEDQDCSSTDTSSTSDNRRCSGGFFDVKVFLLLTCLVATTHGFAENGINNINLPMYERRFQLTSTQTGLMVSSYDVISLIVLAVSGYFVTRVNQPRLIGGSALCSAFGSILMALPHFLTDDYQAIDAKPNMCYAEGNSTVELCNGKDSSLSNYLYVFIAGQTFLSLSGTLLQLVGPAFIDGSVSNKQSPIYISLFYSSVVLGPSIGFLLGGWLLKKYVDIPKQPPISLTLRSPAWVGAWWIGFLISAGLGFILAFPLFTFPKVLPGTAARRKNNGNQTHNDKKFGEENRTSLMVGKVRNMPKILLQFGRNPAFICQCIANTCEGIVLSGTMSFMTKFLANQFKLNAGSAAMISGLVAVPSTFLGQISGGLTIKKSNMKIRDILRLNVIVTAICIVLSGGYFVSCDMNGVAGVTHPYNESSSLPALNGGTGLTAECNADCRCDTSSYKPVCIDGMEYFTPCHAGCSTNPQMKAYSNCSCASWTVTNSIEQPERVMAVFGKCDNECNRLYIFLPFLSLIMIFTLFLNVPSTTVALRCVDDSQRTFALAVQQFMMRSCGAIPGPLLYGAILDNACLVWQEKCGEEGSCWIYDNKLLGRSFFITAVSFKFVSLIALSIAYKLYVPPKKEQGEPEEKI